MKNGVVFGDIRPMSRHTYNSGIIGNCAFLAHVQKSTNISWMCWPAFDSSFVFGSMLDKEKGGEFSILPEGEYTSEQYYIENTNVLRTEITCASGVYRVTDFAPRFRQHDRYFKPLMLIRKVEPLRDEPHILSIGDDLTDEDTFRALPEEAITIKVGTDVSAARYYLESHKEVRPLLKQLI